MYARRLSAIIVSILLGSVAIWYSYLIIQQKIEPVFSSWLLFAAATTISLFTYLRSDNGKKDLITNIGNTADFSSNWLIFLALIFFGTPNYDLRTSEIICLGLSGIIIVYYFLAKKATISNIAINIVMALGYWPTISYLYLSKQDSESLLFWLVGLVALVFASYNPIKEKDYLALLYVARAFLLITIIVILILVNR